MNSHQPSVLFVCLGNICRSPTAQGVFEKKLAHSALAGQVRVDSAGTAAYHLGKAPDKRSISMARSRGYELGHLRARQVSEEDFHQFDLILAMDQSNFVDLQMIQPIQGRAELRMFLSFAETEQVDVPDPYYGGTESFAEVVGLVESAADGIISHLLNKYS